MGTHPIFESDFDCLTEKCKLENVREKKMTPAQFSVATLPDAYFKRLERIQRLSAIIISMGLVSFIIQTCQILSYRLAMRSTIFPFPQVGQGFVLSISAIGTGLYGLKVTQRATRVKTVVYLLLNGFISFVGLVIFITNIWSSSYFRLWHSHTPYLIIYLLEALLAFAMSTASFINSCLVGSLSCENSKPPKYSISIYNDEPPSYDACVDLQVQTKSV